MHGPEIVAHEAGGLFAGENPEMPALQQGKLENRQLADQE
jgi:hypothetical protein